MGPGWAVRDGAVRAGQGAARHTRVGCHLVAVPAACVECWETQRTAATQSQAPHSPVRAWYTRTKSLCCIRSAGTACWRSGAGAAGKYLAKAAAAGGSAAPPRPRPGTSLAPALPSLQCQQDCAALWPPAQPIGGPAGASASARDEIHVLDLAALGPRAARSPHESISSSGLNRPWAGGMSLCAWGGPGRRGRRGKRVAPRNAGLSPVRVAPSAETRPKRTPRPTAEPGRTGPGLSWARACCCKALCESPMVASGVANLLAYTE
jgi:hypothetical protein